MIKAAICCGGGFSSSTMAEHIKKGIKAYHLEQELSIEFCPFLLASKSWMNMIFSYSVRTFQEMFKIQCALLPRHQTAVCSADPHVRSCGCHGTVHRYRGHHGNF